LVLLTCDTPLGPQYHNYRRTVAHTPYYYYYYYYCYDYYCKA
jgi:hypothetical protein